MKLVRAAASEPNEPNDEPHSGDADVRGSHSSSNFTPSRALEAVGERWSLLIMREAVFHDVTRFSDFERRVGVERDILAARLDGFVGAGLMTSRPAGRTGGEPEYLLTRNGRNLEPVIVALSTWADSWAVSPVTELAGEIVLAQPDAVHTAESAPSESIRAVAAIGGPERLLIEISLLGSFDLRVSGASVASLAVGSQRLLAFLALHDRAVARIAMAGAMWPEVSDERAGISLRSALSRLDAATRDAILSASPGLSLAEAVVVDLREGQALARRLLQQETPPRTADVSPAAVALLSLELLPDWYDDWVLAEAEDWRQLRMSALEAQTVFLTAAGRLAEAAGAARAAMKVEPLRESGHASLIRVHLAGGNQSEALRVYERYRALLDSVLGLAPTALITSLVADIQKS
jgi:DNA-binding SARP family transcriptional activator/DNA-binding HxlR family transcriptional regulator